VISPRFVFMEGCRRPPPARARRKPRQGRTRQTRRLRRSRRRRKDSRRYSGALSFSLEHAEAQSRRCANSFHCHDARIQAGTAEVQTDRGSKSAGNQAARANNGFGSKIHGDGFGPKDHHDCDRVGSQNRDGNHDDSKQEALNVFPAND